MTLRHLPYKEIQFLRMGSGNSLLEPMSVNHSFFKPVLSTEDDGEPLLFYTKQKVILNKIRMYIDSKI